LKFVELNKSIKFGVWGMTGTENNLMRSRAKRLAQKLYEITKESGAPSECAIGVYNTLTQLGVYGEILKEEILGFPAIIFTETVAKEYKSLVNKG